MRKHLWQLALTGAWLLSSACSPYLSRGSSLYEEGRYIEAAEVFERTEDRLAVSDTEERAQYALYRGLTFLALGDQQSARQWLGEAHRIDRRHPDVFDEAQKQRLIAGWRKLDVREVAQPRFEPTPSIVAHGPPEGAPGSHRGNGRRSVSEHRAVR